MLALNTFFTLLPKKRLEELACRYQLDSQHSVKLSGPGVFLCMLCGLLYHQELTQRLLEDSFARQTGTTADHSSFGKALGRMDPAYFAALFESLYRKIAPQMSAGEKRALRIRFVDATIVTLSAKLMQFGLLAGTRKQPGSHRQVKSVLELSQDKLPTLLHVCSDPSEAADSVALGASMLQHSQPGDLFIFDRGCDARSRLLALHQAGAFFLTPLGKQSTLATRLLYEAPIEKIPLPDQAPAKGEADWVVVHVEQALFGKVGSAKPSAWQAMPLILVHLVRFDARSRSWKPMTLMTNLALSQDGEQAGPYTWEEVARLYRQRWQIEAFIKFLKQYLSYSHLLSRQQAGIQIMLYMSLIAALLLVWYQRQTRIDRGWRSVKFWLAQDVAAWTQQVLETSALVPDG